MSCITVLNWTGFILPPFHFFNRDRFSSQDFKNFVGDINVAKFWLFFSLFLKICSSSFVQAIFSSPCISRTPSFPTQRYLRPTWWFSAISKNKVSRISLKVQNLHASHVKRSITIINFYLLDFRTKQYRHVLDIDRNVNRPTSRPLRQSDMRVFFI